MWCLHCLPEIMGLRKCSLDMHRLQVKFITKVAWKDDVVEPGNWHKYSLKFRLFFLSKNVKRENVREYTFYAASAQHHDSKNRVLWVHIFALTYLFPYSVTRLTVSGWVLYPRVFVKVHFILTLKSCMLVHFYVCIVLWAQSLLSKWAVLLLFNAFKLCMCSGSLSPNIVPNPTYNGPTSRVSPSPHKQLAPGSEMRGHLV